MNIDDMTYGELKRIAQMFGCSQPAPAPHPMVGQYVILRCAQAGVHAGTLVSQTGQEAVLSGSRRLWSWTCQSGVALSGVAANGLNRAKSKVDVKLDRIALTGVIETIPCTAAAMESIDAA